NRRNFRTYRDLYHSVFQYIEGFYNSRRPHGSLGYLTPDEMEATFWDRQGI
ncbi:IS3 family transposase, partial [Anaerotignum sp.]